MTLKQHEYTPQDFLDVVEKLLSEGKYATKTYLVEHDKPTVNRRSDGMDIRVQNVVATPVRALRWDYLIGDSLINSRQFIIADNRYAQYLIDLYDHHPMTPRSSLRVKLFKFKEERLSPYLIQEHNLKESNLEKKLELDVNLPLEIKEVIVNNTENDEFSSNLLKELERTSKG